MDEGTSNNNFVGEFFYVAHVVSTHFMEEYDIKK